MAEILKGAPVAAALSEELIARAETLKQAGTVRWPSCAWASARTTYPMRPGP